MNAQQKVIALFGAAWLAVLLFALDQPPRLVGYGCDGSGVDGVLYANEEDEFPRCDVIEANTDTN